MTKSVLFLGASHQQLAPLHYSRSAGYRVITCDNRPDNPGHKLAHRSYSVSTTAAEAILSIARLEEIDAVVSYGSDVAAPTAALIAERIGIVGNPLTSVRTLTNKGLFRRFQAEHGYFCPRNLTVSRMNVNEAGAVVAKVRDSMSLPVIVKPVDASGAKGIRKVYAHEDLAPAIEYALGHSLSATAIVEEIVDHIGYQVCGEGFLQDGRIIFHAFANEHFCQGITVPVGETFPSIFDERLVDKAVGELQSIFDRLAMRQGPFNFDLLFTISGDVFVIEIGPRNGGNRMPEAIKYGNGADTIAATVESALGREVSLQKATNFFFSTYSVHAKRDGTFRGIAYGDRLRKCIVDERIFATPGDPVSRFEMGSLMLGNLILTFDTYTDMISMTDTMDEYVQLLM